MVLLIVRHIITNDSLYEIWNSRLGSICPSHMEPGEARFSDCNVPLYEKLRDTYDTLVAMPGNSVCCDCGSSNNTWASTNLGVVVCNECVGAHRSLGVHISKPLSLKMDIWDEEQRAHILARGNEKVNAELEAHPETSQHKPPPDAPIEAKAAFVRAKVGCPLSFVLLPPSSLSRAQRRECNVCLSHDTCVAH